MPWKVTPKLKWHMLGAPIRASAGGGEYSRLSREQERVLRTAVLSRAVDEGLIPQNDLDNWRRYAEGDLWGTVDLLNQMADARRQSANGSLTATAPRREPDAEAIIAAAIEDGRFSAQRADHWRQRLAADPRGTRVLLTAPPDQGGLTPLLAASPRPASPEREQAQHERAFAATFPSQARELGYEIRRVHPLNPALPGTSEPPRQERRRTIVDRS